MALAVTVASCRMRQMALIVSVSWFFVRTVVFFRCSSLPATGSLCVQYLFHYVLRCWEMEPPTKKRKVLTLEERADIIRAVASGQKSCCRARLPSTLSTILKSKDAIISATTATTLSATSSGHPSKKKNFKTTPQEKIERRALHLVYGYASQKRSTHRWRGVAESARFRVFAWIRRVRGKPWLAVAVSRMLRHCKKSVNKVGADDW